LFSFFSPLLASPKQTSEILKSSSFSFSFPRQFFLLNNFYYFFFLLNKAVRKSFVLQNRSGINIKGENIIGVGIGTGSSSPYLKVTREIEASSVAQ